MLLLHSIYSSDHTFSPACLQRYFEAALHIELIGDEENLQDFLDTFCDLLGKSDMSSLLCVQREFVTREEVVISVFFCKGGN
jgi:hypothetical protein